MNGTLALQFKDAQEAARALAALEPEGAEGARLDGAQLSFIISGKPLGILRSMDDILSCLRAAFPDA